MSKSIVREEVVIATNWVVCFVTDQVIVDSFLQTFFSVINHIQKCGYCCQILSFGRFLGESYFLPNI